MGNFNRDRNDRRGGFGGRRSFGDRDRGGFGRGDRGSRQMFKTICSNCGKECEVPFKPTGDKPVYCSDCFEKMGGKSERRSFDRPRREEGNGRNEELKSQLESLNGKLDKIISLLQPKVVEEKPVELTVEVPAEKAKTKSTKAKKSSKAKTEEVTE